MHIDLETLVQARYTRYRDYGAFTTTDLPVRERRERQNWVERLRAVLDSGQSVLSVGEGQRLAPDAADDIEEGRQTEVDGHAHLGDEEGDK